MLSCGAVFVVLSLVVPAALAAPGSRDDPYPVGAVVKMDGFTVRVVSVDPDAWPRIRSGDPSNSPPQAGAAYVLVTIRATNHGDSPGIPFVNGLLQASGRSRVTYNPLADGCGTIPSDVADIDAVSPGASVIEHACWEVEQADVPSLLMYYESYDGGPKTFFALSAPKARRASM